MKVIGRILACFTGHTPAGHQEPGLCKVPLSAVPVSFPRRRQQCFGLFKSFRSEQLIKMIRKGLRIAAESRLNEFCKRRGLIASPLSCRSSGRGRFGVR